MKLPMNRGCECVDIRILEDLEELNRKIDMELVKKN